MPDRDRGLRNKWVARFENHHDLLSIRRQRGLATAQLFVNLLVVVLYVLAIHAWHWKLKLTGDEEAVGVTLWVISLSLLAVSSLLVMAVMGMREGWGFGVGGLGDSEPARLSKYRKYVYYPAVYLNFVAIAVFVEETGGLVRSPFAPVLFALILGAQALSRFNTNSRFYIIAGVVVTGCLLLIEYAFGTRNVPDAPRALLFWTVAAVFLVTALVTHLGKGKNYKAADNFPAPRGFEVYLDNSNTWRFAMYCDINTKLDQVLVLPAGHTSATDATDAVDAIALPLLSGGADAVRINWQYSDDKKEALGAVRKV